MAMSKFVTINYYPHFLFNKTIVCYGDGDLKPFKITLNVNSIMSIANKPCDYSVYMSYSFRGTDCYRRMSVHLLNTNAAVGLGLNDVDFKSYYITEESYRKLMSVLDPVQCA